MEIKFGGDLRTRVMLYDSEDNNYIRSRVMGLGEASRYREDAGKVCKVNFGPGCTLTYVI